MGIILREHIRRNRYAAPSDTKAQEQRLRGDMVLSCRNGAPVGKSRGGHELISHSVRVYRQPHDRSDSPGRAL